MNILFLAHRVPFPPNKGDKIRSFNVLMHLAKRHRVHLGCLIDDESDLRYVGEIERRVARFAFVRIRPRMKRLLALAGLVRSRPLSVEYFYSRALQRQVDAIIGSVDIDAFVCSSSPMAEYVFRSQHARNRIGGIKIMDLIDVDSRKWAQYAEQSPVWTSWLYEYEARHLGEYEKRIAREFDRVLVVTDEEKAVFPGIGRQNLSAMSNGVDLDFFQPGKVPDKPSEKPTLVFTGAMDYRPNIEGIQWFVRAVLPRVQQAVPEVELFIVGSRPTAAVVALGRVKGVTVTGEVEDVRPYIARASVCIAPLLVARGIQNKVLEAMAMGKAVVCSTQAHEGILAEPGKELLVADGADALASATVDLLARPDKRTQLGLAARRCVEEKYSWERSLRLLDQILASRTAGGVYTGHQENPAADARI